MPTSLRARVRGPRTGHPATPVEYVLLAVTAMLLVALVFFALGRLVTDQLDSSCDAQVPASISAVPADATRC